MAYKHKNDKLQTSERGNSIIIVFIRNTYISIRSTSHKHAKNKPGSCLYGTYMYIIFQIYYIVYNRTSGHCIVT